MISTCSKQKMKAHSLIMSRETVGVLGMPHPDTSMCMMVEKHARTSQQRGNPQRKKHTWVTAYPSGAVSYCTMPEAAHPVIQLNPSLLKGFQTLFNQWFISSNSSSRLVVISNSHKRWDRFTKIIKHNKKITFKTTVKSKMALKGVKWRMKLFWQRQQFQETELDWKQVAIGRDRQRD